MDQTQETIKATEKETLATFQEEIPSQYFSHLDEKEFKKFTKNAENYYRDLFKFPKEMFIGKELIDFGAGTGENTIYLSNFGADCTLVEMNYLSQDISKEVFKKYSRKEAKTEFVLSSIFDYQPNNGKLYDIVHCRGVLSHTSAKEKAFQHIASFLKPGGYLIFGDPNKSGGFQNMLQRYAVYKFAKTPDEMVEVCENLFKKDIDRSERAVKRTRRAIIFDRWVIQSQDDPSVEEVFNWCETAGLKIYSTYPYSNSAFLGDSIFHFNKFDPYQFTNLFAIPEITWMLQTEEDQTFLKNYNNLLSKTSNSLKEISSLMANFQKKSSLDPKEFSKSAQEFSKNLNEVDLLSPLKSKLETFLYEATLFIKAVEKGDLNEVKKEVDNFSILFTGAVGVRHVDFIAYKNK